MRAAREYETAISEIFHNVRVCGSEKHTALVDIRFRTLLGPAKWAALPQTVQNRFSKRLNNGKAVTYTGRVTQCRMNIFGWALAQLGRFIGAPLPLSRDVNVPAIVTVTEDEPSGGQIWSRMYGRHNGFPQVIHSAKRFAGSTGLEEYLGGGFGIALNVSANDQAIRFVSDHYFVIIRNWRLRIPRWLAPGALTIDHIDQGVGCFEFVLALDHVLFGELMHQTGSFHDQEVADTRGVK